MNPDKKYKVIIIEPSVVIQQGMKQMLNSLGCFDVGYCFSDYQSFSENWKKSAPDILVMNPNAAGTHKPFVVQNLFTEYTDTVFIALLYNYMHIGTIESFDGSIEIYDKSPLVLKKIQKAIETNNFQKGFTENAELSDREKEILISVTKGLTNREIAEKHSISIHTVISHRKNITKKTGIKTVSGLTIYAISHHLILNSV